LDNRAIGVFDSGLGGLTVVKELMKRLPNENIVYFGDTGRVPYGTRSKETVIKYVFQDIRFLLNFDIKLIVIACGTASSIALEVVRPEFEVPIIGVVHSAAHEAVKTTKNKKIGVIGTQGTISSGSYVKEIKKLDSDVEVFPEACPLFVPLVENGYGDEAATMLIAEDYLRELKQKGIDTLVLGCTHYPLLKNNISAIMGEKVNLIDIGIETAKHIEKIITDKGIGADNIVKPEYRYFVSDSIGNFSKLGSMFLEKAIDNSVKKIDIEKY
jgi:glutamate racemase